MTDYAIIQDSLNNLFEPQISEVISSAIFKSTVRLDASFYGNLNHISKSVNNAPLHEFCERIFNPPVFKREFQETEKSGCRYLASAEIISLDPDETFIHDMQAKILDLKVYKGWVLITGFGTIGSIRMVDNVIEGFAVANNVARIIPKKPLEISGFITAFLSCPVGKALLNDHASGSVVRYIEAPTISNIPIPIINEVLIKKINKNYLQALSLREEVFNILNQSEKLIHEVNGLPILREGDAAWFDADRNIETVLISSSEVIYNNHSGSEYRLDAHFYNPLAQLAIRNIGQSKSAVKTIDEVTERVFFLNRFARTFVNEDRGIPYLAGSDIIKIRPANDHFLSKTQTNNLDQYLLQRGWILLTCSGTIGRTAFVWGNFESYAATHDLIRIIPNTVNIDAGYLYAFLSSPYGKQQVLRFTHGSVIDHITPEQVKKVLIPLPSEVEQETIGDLVRTAYEKRAEAIRLEDEAQKILMDALT